MSKYFNEEVDEAIKKFQLTNDRKEKDVLCRERILPAFIKLSTYHYHKVPIIKNEDIIDDCVAYLYEKIPMFDSTKADHAFSYFNTIARNFIFQKLKSEKKEISQEQKISLNDDANILLNDNLIEDEFEKIFEKKEFTELFKEQLVKWRDKAEKDHERQVLDALIIIFQNTHNIDIYKKKAISYYLKELIGESMNSKQIASNLLKIKKKFLNFKKRYLRGEI